MGLAGARKRVKINNDPNNTQWARSTSNYGHRMLVSQGWQPGGVLGSADNPEYSDHHLTEASRSHIKAMLREDNLGLGAKKGSGQEAGECVGLDAFQGLLGRLNGKSDELLAKEQKSRDDLKRARYMEQRGTVRFVRGGTLVSDMDELIELARRSRIDMKARVASLKASAEEEQGESSKKKKHKKERQVIGSEAAAVSVAMDGVRHSSATAKEQKKKSKKRKNKETDVDSSRQEDEIATSSQRPVVLADSVSLASSSPEQPGDEDEATRKARRRAEKAEKRERKQRKKEERAARKAQTLLGITTVEVEGPTVEEVIKETITIETAPKSSTTTTATTTTVQQAGLGGRHTSVRSRYIAAKRRAVMDPQALKEILMVKA